MIGDEMRKTWPFAFNFLQYVAIFFLLPFFVLYYQELGFTGTEIGLLTGIGPIITLFFTPIWTGLADATQRHRLLMSIGILGVVLSAFAYPFLNAFMPVFIVTILFNVFLAPLTPLADSATMYMLADEKEMYSRIRLGATLGYGVAALIAGVLVNNYGLKVAFWGCATVSLLLFIVSQKLVYGQLVTDNPLKGRVRALLTNPRWILFLVVAFAGGVAIAVFNSYLFPYMGELGADESIMGLALVIGTISEIPVLFFGNKLIKYLSPYRLLMLSLAAAGIRMLLFAASRTPTMILVIQMFNGLTLSIMWVAGVSYANENAPEGMSATAQGLFNMMALGIGGAVGGFIGGPLLESVGGRGLYFIFGLAVLVIVAIVALLYRVLITKVQLSPDALVE
jgi:PPP family 3-phenylpropionic acid transporter